MTMHRLPFGGYTIDADEYGRAWKELGERAEKFFPGYEWVAFDPNIRLDRKDRRSDKRTHIELTPEAVKALCAPPGAVDDATRQGLLFAKDCVGYRFHHEPNKRSQALDSMTVLDKLLEGKAT